MSFVARCYTVGMSESAQGIKPGDRAKYLEARDCYSGSAWLMARRTQQAARLGHDHRPSPSGQGHSRACHNPLISIVWSICIALASLVVGGWLYAIS